MSENHENRYQLRAAAKAFEWLRRSKPAVEKMSEGGPMNRGERVEKMKKATLNMLPPNERRIAGIACSDTC